MSDSEKAYQEWLADMETKFKIHKPAKRKRKSQGNSYAKFVGNLLKTDSQIRNLPNKERLKAAAAKWKEHKLQLNEGAGSDTPKLSPKVKEENKTNTIDDDKNENDEPPAKRVRPEQPEQPSV